MTALRAKPHLSLSVSSSKSPNSPAGPSSNPSGTSSRRVASWGSSTSETHQSLRVLGEREMTPLPSPSEGREWGFLPEEAGRKGWQGSWPRSTVGGGRPRGSSVFEEMRDGSLGGYSPSPSGADSWMSYAGGESSANRDWNGPKDLLTSPGAGSKTMSFFDTVGGANSEDSMVLSPPPNPPSRNNSLNARPSSSFLPASRHAPAAPLVSNDDRAPPSAPKDDVLRSSVASSSGGSWLEEAAEKSGGTLWTRGRGGSIGSVASNGGTWTGGRSEPRPPPVPRQRYSSRSPSRLEPPTSTSIHTPSPVTALRPRLAALNTSLTSSPSPSLDGVYNSPTAVPLAHRPMSSLPSAVEGSPSSISARTRFIHNHHSHYPLSSPSAGSPSRSTPLLSDLSPLAERPTPSQTPREGLSPTEERRRSQVELRPAEATSAPMQLEDSYSPRVGDRVGEFVVERLLGKGAFSRVALARRGRVQKGKAREQDDGNEEKVALKLIAKRTCEGNERMRISVLREVEVLKNIHHPSLVSLSASFATPIYTVLVLDVCPGGELFDFLAEHHEEITEPLARRMFGELCSAVGWMHGIGLVHRDIKLENILLTSRPFPCSNPSTLLSSLPTPFVKLTDFGLSRFINPSAPLLRTRCGSEAYAAPELIMGKPYDGRCTDAWALGVVLFAIVTGGMPFVEEPVVLPGVGGLGGGGGGGGEGTLARKGSRGGGRKGYLLKIAKADYAWPEPPSLADSSSSATPSDRPPPPSSSSANSSSARLVTPSLQALVGRLLVRDPAKRLRVDEVWSMDWIEGEGRPEPVRGVVRRPSAGGAEMGGEDSVEWSRRGSELFE
ncbi:hypothetical protein JCM1841_003038 [Sporobolomyces salmonicolor]